MSLAIITGVSKGLGASLAEQFLENKINVLGISRRDGKDLKKIGDANDVYYEHLSYDLSNVSVLQEKLGYMTDKVLDQQPLRMILLNNAAVLEPINQAMNITANDLIHHVQVNTIAPMLIMNHFLKVGTKNNIPIDGINITSGAARRPIYGWSAYGSTKAGIDLYTQTVALEQAQLETGHKVIAFSPGVMDTEMQQKIRASSYEQFQDVKTFQKYHQQDQLKQPNEIAQVIITLVKNRENIENGKIYDVKDLM